MKGLVIISAICILLGCSFKGSKFIRKYIQTNDISLKWYYYSYITSGSPDIVEVEKNGEVKEIFRGMRVILDVVMKESVIFVKTVTPSKGYPLTNKMEDSVFGYRIVFDTTGVPEDLNFIPKGVKE